MKVAFVMALLATTAAAQVEWHLQGGRAKARVVQREGTMHVHFPVQGGGKPASLAFPIAAGASVDIACKGGPNPSGSKLELVEAASWDRGSAAPALEVRTSAFDEERPSNHRVQATVEARERGTFGLVARHRAGQGAYLFAIDWQRRSATLERRLGGDQLVIARAEIEVRSAAPTLMLQVDGFRLTAYIDDEPVLRAFDGALQRGAAGIAWQGTEPVVRDLRIADPVPQTASAALVQVGNVATLHAAVTVPPGHLYCVELLLDRPHPWVPRTANGMEPRLNGGEAAPVVLRADWRHSLGKNGLGWVPVSGRLSATIVVPELTQLRHRAVLVRALLVTPDGEQVVGATPVTRLIL